MADGDVTCHTVSHLCPSVTRHADMSRASRSGPSLCHVSIIIIINGCVQISHLNHIGVHLKDAFM